MQSQRHCYKLYCRDSTPGLKTAGLRISVHPDCELFCGDSTPGLRNARTVCESLFIQAMHHNVTNCSGGIRLPVCETRERFANLCSSRQCITMLRIALQDSTPGLRNARKFANLCSAAVQATRIRMLLARYGVNLFRFPLIFL